MRTVKQKSVLFFKDCRKTPFRYIYIYIFFNILENAIAMENFFQETSNQLLKYWNDFNSKLYELFI